MAKCRGCGKAVRFTRSHCDDCSAQQEADLKREIVVREAAIHATHETKQVAAISTTQTTLYAPPAVPIPDAGKTYRGLAYVFMVTSCAFLAWGGWCMYAYDALESSSDHIVGGDAYNYVIHATRGVGLIGIGIAIAVFACTLAVLGGHVLMGTDAPESMGFSLMQGNNVFINLEPDTRSETDKLFRALSGSGKVEMPLQEMFWGGYFGSLTDQFGIHWMFNRNSKT
jgi:hypothetical protein